LFLKYDAQNGSFTVLEATDTEGEVAQESTPEEQPDKKPEEPQEEPPTEEQPNEPQDTSPGAQQPQEQTPQQQALTEQEIKSRALNAAREDVLKNYPSAIFTKSYDENLIEDLGNNCYQCCIVCTQPAPGFVFLYLVRYDPNEVKWYTPFKTDYLKFHTRAANSVKNYIEKQDNWVQNNCNGVIFDNDSVKVNEWKDSNGKTVLCKFKVDIKFQCQGKDGSSKWYDCAVNTRYDILSDSFVEFDMGCTGS